MLQWCNHIRTNKLSLNLKPLLLHYHFHSTLPLNKETLNTTPHARIIPHTLLMCYRSARCSSFTHWAAVAVYTFTGHQELQRMPARVRSVSESVPELPTSLLSVCVRCILHPPTQKPGRHARVHNIFTYTWAQLENITFLIWMQDDLLSANFNTSFHTYSAADIQAKQQNVEGSHWLTWQADDSKAHMVATVG